MRLAVFTSQFPGRVNTFFARDMRALIDAGMTVDVYPLHPLDPAMWAYVPDLLDAGVLPRERVHHLSLTRDWLGGKRLPLHTWRALARDVVDIERDAARHGQTAAAKTAYALARAVRWARTRRDGIDHVLAYWGNYPATAAYVFQRLVDPEAPLSIVLHAGTDLYRTPVFLGRKLLYADNIFVVCEFNRRFLAQQHADVYRQVADRIRLHHLGLDLEELPCSTARPAPPHLLAVGSLERVKGFDVLLRAVAALAARGIRTPLTIIGVGPDDARLRSLAASLGIADRTRFEGWMPFDAVREAMQRATLLVHPSSALGDAVPTVIKECLALGTPVIASDVAGIPELLDDGRCGVLVAPGDVDGLARAIADLWDDQPARERLALAGRAQAERLFDIRITGARWAAALAGTPRRRRGAAHAPMAVPLLDTPARCTDPASSRS